MSHDRPRVRKEDIDLQKEHVKKLKIKEFIVYKDQLVAGRAQGHYELEILDKLDKGVLLSPDINTLWNYRKQIICHFIQSELDAGHLPWISEADLARVNPIVQHNRETFTYDLDANALQLHKHDKIKQILEKELIITERVLRERNVKSYGCWYHRKWSIKHLPHMWQNDLQLTALLLKSDERNCMCAALDEIF